MTSEIDFDVLARKANTSGGASEDLNNLFGAAFALENWHFIARGVIPNINPYIAGRADYMAGQNMVRAFTDTKRLARFAKENNLTNPDGSTQMLDVPVGGIIDYLEQFIKHGVGGVWLNSDTESDGFSIPLAQLRPIKDHLANIRWKSISEPTNPNLKHNSGFVPPANAQSAGEGKLPLETVYVSVNDGLMMPSGFVKESSYTCNFYCRVPPAWTEGGKLKDDYLEKLYEKIYGATWRTGNSDGSRYVVQKSFSTILTPENVRETDWTATKNNDKNHFWYYIAAGNGEIKNVTPQEFQKDVEAAPPAPAPVSTDAPPTSNLENWGLSNLPDDSADLRIKFFRPGTVKPGISLLSFYAAIVPLLKDYQGSGEFQKIFSFVPEAMKDLTEKFSSNNHGEYFRIRHFQYHPPNTIADVSTIDSNQLRHIQTGATLAMSFALLQIPDNPTAAFYFGFEGGKDEVFKLLSAITQALETAEFIAEEAK